MIRVDPRDPLEIIFLTQKTRKTRKPCGMGMLLYVRNTQRRTLHLRHHPDGKHKQRVCASANFAYSA